MGRPKNPVPLADRETSVYVLHAGDGRVRYVGIAHHPGDRLTGHRYSALHAKFPVSKWSRALDLRRS